jgi:hypothetical protein
MARVAPAARRLLTVRGGACSHWRAPSVHHGKLETNEWSNDKRDCWLRDHYMTITLSLALVLVCFSAAEPVFHRTDHKTLDRHKSRAFSANGVLTASATLRSIYDGSNASSMARLFVLSNSPCGNLYGPCGECDGSWFWPRRHHQLWFDLGRIRDELA